MRAKMGAYASRTNLDTLATVLDCGLGSIARRNAQLVYAKMEELARLTIATVSFACVALDTLDRNAKLVRIYF